MVYIKTYMFNHFYQQYLVLLTMAPRNSTYLYIFSVASGTVADFFFYVSGWRVFCDSYVFFCFMWIGLLVGRLVGYLRQPTKITSK